MYCLASLMLATLGIVITLGAAITRARWRHFIQRVYAGHEPGWAVFPRGDVVEEHELVPLEPGNAWTHVLVREHEAGGSAHRSTKARVAWALVSPY